MKLVLTSLMMNTKMCALIQSMSTIISISTWYLQRIQLCHIISKKKRKTAIPEELEAVDIDGILIDIDVQSVAGSVSTHEGKTADLDEFYGAAFNHVGMNGKVKKHRKCKVCL